MKGTNKFMMTPKGCAEAWKVVRKCFNATIETNRPDYTMKTIINELGLEKTKEVFATIAAIKRHDGRIYGENRKYVEAVLVNPECVEWKSTNPVIHTGLDDIHTAHINNLITELRVYEKNLNKEQEELER